VGQIDWRYQCFIFRFTPVLAPKHRRTGACPPKKREFQAKGINLRTNRRAERSILTLHGKLVYSRNVLIPANQESKELLASHARAKKVIPLDDALGISNLPFKMTPALMLRCAYWAQNQCSYQAAEDVMRSTYGLNINDDTIRMVTNHIGKAVFEEDCRQAELAFGIFDSGKAVCKKDKKGILYVETDGVALNTRHKNNEGSTWRENKLGVIYSSDHIHYWRNKKGEREHRITERDYVSYVGSAAEFKKHLYRCPIRNGYSDYKETVVLSDGAAWIANMAEELFPDAQHILDLFHLKENVYDFAKNRFQFEEAKYVPWAERICGLLEDGKSEDVLKELNPDENYSNCVNLHHYITMHREHINYPEYKRKGYFCGSGAVESGNKVVLQKRLKQAGMRWETETAQYLLTLKSKYESGRWEKDVVTYFLNYIRALK